MERENAPWKCPGMTVKALIVFLEYLASQNPDILVCTEYEGSHVPVDFVNLVLKDDQWNQHGKDYVVIV